MVTPLHTVLPGQLHCSAANSGKALMSTPLGANIESLLADYFSCPMQCVCTRAYVCVCVCVCVCSVPL